MSLSLIVLWPHFAVNSEMVVREVCVIKIDVSIIVFPVGSGFLWWTWFRLPSEGNQVERSHIPIINVDVKNKTTFLVFSITATVLTVI